MTPVAAAVGAGLARAAGVAPEPLTWEVTDGPWFDNQVATLDLAERRASFSLDKALGPADGDPRLERVTTRVLA